MEKEFIQIINDHRRLIYKVCNLYGRAGQYQDDLFQEIVLQLWRAFPGFRNESLITTWMYRVALNTAISYFRREQKRIVPNAVTREAFQVPEFGRDMEEENMRALSEAIQQLTKIEKAVIMLYLDEKSYQEIGDILGITVSNVGVKINRIKTKLEKIIKSQMV
jgi:RNA polymerase sigma-70 factor (ECF subfamily)